MARPTTLWGTIDRDRRRWIRTSLLVLGLFLLLAFSVLLFVFTKSFRALELGFRVIFPLGAVLLFPIIRTIRSQRVFEVLGAVPAPTGAVKDTKSALYEACLAVGLPKPPALSLYGAEDNVNAFVFSERGKLKVAASLGFTTLPKAEQRAGFALLFGRGRVDLGSFAADDVLRQWGREEKIEPARDPAYFRSWLDAAYAGDCEGLHILREPEPVIALLERLGTVQTAAAGLATVAGSGAAAFNFLAWPYADFYDDNDMFGPALSPIQNAAVGAVIAEEVSLGLMVPRAHSVGNPEALRAVRIRELAGAEGAIVEPLPERVSVCGQRALGQRDRAAGPPGGAERGSPATGVVPGGG